MAESGEVRLVRCPKCENLLPEMPGYSVYQCGGCGAVLRAKRSDPEGDSVPVDKSAEARSAPPSEKSENFSGNHLEASPAKSVSAVDCREGAVSDSDGSSGAAVAESGDNDSKETAQKWTVENGKMGKTELQNGSLESSDVKRSVTQVEKANGSMSSSKIIKQKEPEKGEIDGVEMGRLRKGENESVRFRPLNHAGEGTSRNYTNGNYYKRASVLKNSTGVTNSNGVEHDKPNREELLRKLEELKEQLNQSCDINDKTKDKVPVEPRIFRCQDPYADFHDYPSRVQSGSRQFCDPNEHSSRTRLYDHYHEPLSTLNRSENYRLPAQDLSGVSEYESSFGPQLPTRHHQHRIIPGHPPNPRSHSYVPEHYPFPEPDPFEPRPLDTQFPCSCYHCYLRHPHLPMPVHPYRRYPLVPNNPLPCHYENHGAFAPHGGYHSRISRPRPFVGSRDTHPQSNTRLPTDADLESGGLAHSRPQRVGLANRVQPCRPIAGGAPFITCHNCSELLELPKKVSNLERSPWKICCGGCSTVISFTLVDEKLVPVETPPKKSLRDALDSSGEVMDDKPYDPHGGMRRDNAGFHSEDYDTSNYDFQSMDKEHVSSSTMKGFNLSKSEELQNLQVLSPSTSEDEDSYGNSVVSDGVRNGSELQRAILSPPLPGSPLQEHFDHSSKYRAVNRCEKGSLSSRSDQEKVVSKNALRQNSLQDSLATEMEISHKDYYNQVASHDDVNVNKDADQPKGKRDSFFAGIIKKSLRDISKPNHAGENWKRNVMVNGHLIPDRLVNKAEKLAGPVSPGQYWYDFRAGFWGAMGGPCLGIIPRHIEEFNYPMAVKCAGGNTDIFVNGRELHQKDLELLAGRGLPTTRHRSYIIEISGRVLDEDSGEELDSLGKLAPTVEKVKHGFGMRVPKATA